MEWFKIKERDCPHKNFYFICLFFLAVLPKEKYTLPLKQFTYLMAILMIVLGNTYHHHRKQLPHIEDLNHIKEGQHTGRGINTKGDVENITCQPSDVISRGSSSEQKIMLLTF